MKKHVTSLVLAALTSALFFSGCNKPSERPSKMGDDAAKAVAISDLGELALPEDGSAATGAIAVAGDSSGAEAPKRIVYYSGSAPQDITALGSDLEQKKLEGKVEEITKKVKDPAKAAMLADQLKNGVISIVVLEKEVKILKITPEINNDNPNYAVASARLYDAMKSMSLTSDAAAVGELSQKMDTLKAQSPASLGEKFGVVEISAIKVEKYGILEDERTEYGERKSIMNMTAKPFQFSTHIVLGNEVGAPEEASEGASDAAAE